MGDSRTIAPTVAHCAFRERLQEMGYQSIQVVDTTVDAASLVTTAETVVGSIVLPTNLQRDTPVDIEAFVAFTTGANNTAMQMRIREDSLTGTLVGALKTVQIGASLPSGGDISVRDNRAGEIANKTYVVTLQAVGATTNASVQAVTMRAWCQP